MTRQQIADLIEDYAAAKMTGRVALIQTSGSALQQAITAIIPEEVPTKVPTKVAEPPPAP